MADTQTYSRGDFHTYIATRTFHISFDAGKDNKAIRKDDTVSYDGTIVVFSDDTKHTSQELRGAIRQGWLRLEGGVANAVNPNDFRVKIRPADMTGRNPMTPPEKILPEIEGEQARVVGESTPMDGAMRSFLSDLQTTFASMNLPPPAESAATSRTASYPVERMDEGINAGRTVGTIRGFALDVGPNESGNQVLVSRNLRPTIPEAPEVQDPARASFRGYATRENEAVGVIVGGNQVDLEQSVKAVVSSTEDVGTSMSKKAFVGSSAVSPSEAPQRQSIDPKERLRGMIRTPTTFETTLGDPSRDPVKEIDAALAASIEYRKNQITASRHVDTHQDLAHHFQGEGKPQDTGEDDKIRLQTIRFFVPEFTWDKTRTLSSRIQDALSEDIRSMKLRAILAFEDEDARTKIITEFRKIREDQAH